MGYNQRTLGAPHNSADSPVMRQYLEIKSRYDDAVLMFRMGDFYEMFFEDAVTVGPVLDIAVTSRDRNAEQPVPMAGVPYHAIGGYLRTLVQQGFKVAICEQMETPEQAKRRKGPKIVRREVVRVVTPGALLDEEHLVRGEPNYLVAVVRGPGEANLGLSGLDISSGDFFTALPGDVHALRAELARVAPREIVALERDHEWLVATLGQDCPRLEVAEQGASDASRQRVLALDEESGGRGSLDPVGRDAAAMALEYAESTQPGQTLLIHRMRRHDLGGHVLLDEASVRNLEIFATMREGRRKGTLIWAMDQTATAMGARMLRSWIGAPVRTLEIIGARQDGIEVLVDRTAAREEIQSCLKDIRDMARIASRARLNAINPREMGALRASLGALPTVASCLASLDDTPSTVGRPHLLNLGDDLLNDLWETLVHRLIAEPPSVAREGGVIADGADGFLDEQRTLAAGARAVLAEIEARERAATEIPTLKIQHNRVFGYYIEVSKTHLARVPSDYVRKQTLANAERYVTPELAGLEEKILAAQGAALARELELFQELRDIISEAAHRLLDVAERVATVDVLCAMAQVAHECNFVRPEVVDAPVLDVEESRHPVVEQMLPAGRFVPNDLRLRAQGSGAEPRLMLVTGPNMGGKSTVMRQAALMVLLAHTGSFVPAKRARIGLVDRIFTRVGAADDLGRGESTFMVEMRETAQILTQATVRSMVVLDEIGRGTATYDGLSLAWAITEFLHDQIGCRALFATHYHELCGLSARLAGVKNAHVTVHEQRGRVVFLHRLEDGAAGRSYGIHVGKLAGLPRQVLRRAGKILGRLEQQERVGLSPQLDLFASKAPLEETSPAASDLSGVRAAEAVELLRAMDPDELSPRQAHARLCDLVALLSEDPNTDANEPEDSKEGPQLR